MSALALGGGAGGLRPADPPRATGYTVLYSVRCWIKIHTSDFLRKYPIMSRGGSLIVNKNGRTVRTVIAKFARKGPIRSDGA